jgi:hypothetical protein
MVMLSSVFSGEERSGSFPNLSVNFNNTLFHVNHSFVFKVKLATYMSEVQRLTMFAHSAKYKLFNTYHVGKVLKNELIEL